MPKTANVSELKSRCSALIGRVGSVEEIVITGDGQAVARLVPVTPGGMPILAPATARKTW